MNLKLASYTGKFNYDDLSSYFRTIARPQVQSDQYQEAPEGEVKNVKEIKKSSKFQAKCKDETCYLLLINGASENE